MSRAAARAEAAADKLATWLNAPRPTASRHPSAGEAGVTEGERSAAAPEDGAGQAAHEPDAPPAESTPPDPARTAMRDTQRSRQTATAVSPDVQAPAHTDWLFHHLEVRGPAADLQAFRLAARGAGTIPWQLDLDALRDDVFHLLVAPPAPQVRTLSAAGARIMAEELSVAVARRQAAAIARVGISQACPFDLHALLPVPPEILLHGPDHPAALAWLWTHWGTTHPLRHVTLLTKPGQPEQLELRFWSADWTPWSAIVAIRARWPKLRLDVRPQYGAT